MQLVTYRSVSEMVYAWRIVLYVIILKIARTTETTVDL